MNMLQKIKIHSYPDSEGSTFILKGYRIVNNIIEEEVLDGYISIEEILKDYPQLVQTIIYPDNIKKRFVNIYKEDSVEL